MSMLYLTREQVREIDRRSLEEYGIPGIVLMENAGRGCASLLMRFNPERQLTTILCGPGNNGGDGFVIARHLHNHGWPVQIYTLEGFMPHDAETNFAIVQKMHLPMQPITAWNPTTGWIVDALFGTGLTRALGKPIDAIVEAVNSSGLPVLAVDIPSGLHCDSGHPLGSTIRAFHTATFVAMKKGFQHPQAHEWTGEIHIVDIGAPRQLIDEYRSNVNSSDQQL